MSLFKKENKEENLNRKEGNERIKKNMQIF